MSFEKAEKRLMNKAVNYLGRYSASERRLREVLGRFATKKLTSLDAAEVLSATNSVIEKCLRFGYLDDVAFAANRASSERKKGKSSFVIRQKLRQHALADSAIETALRSADANNHNAELAAAIHFARRRRLGPFFPRFAEDRERNRHLGSLARAGFSMTICRTVVDAKSIDDLEELERVAIQPRQADG